MANERYEEEGQEEGEGEYHFSDDQANYDMDMGAAKGPAAAATAFPTKESITDKLKQHRRIVIGIVVFIILLGIVYKLVAPSSSPVTDFQPNAPASAKVTKKAMAPSLSAPSQSQMPQQQQTVTTTTSAAVQQPVTTQPVVTVTQPAVSNNPSVENTNLVDRVTTLEQQNAAMMSLMQTQYAQKIADNEAQNMTLRNQVQELTARISNMEVAFRQLTKILRGANTSSPSSASANRAVIQQTAQAARLRSTYTVQAIIPGRAWLKSDAGDTVTVAEGDVLKDFGRITKIDPYDGIVDIDTGSKIVSLSYGATGD